MLLVPLVRPSSEDCPPNRPLSLYSLMSYLVACFALFAKILAKAVSIKRQIAVCGFFSFTYGQVRISLVKTEPINAAETSQKNIGGGDIQSIKQEAGKV